jgi:hypothetical protein
VKQARTLATPNTPTIHQAEALVSLLFEDIDPASLVDLHWQCLVHVGTDDIGEEITTVLGKLTQQVEKIRTVFPPNSLLIGRPMNTMTTPQAH